jgi:hypothetical protein
MILQTRIGQLLKDLQKLDELNMWLASAGDESVIEAVAELQREQLRRGERPDGSNFDHYSPTSQAIYGKPDTPIKWEDDGYFYKHIQAIVRPDKIEILNEGTIGEQGERINLEVRWNEIIIGLQNDSIQELIEKVKEKYLQNIRKLLRIG